MNLSELADLPLPTGWVTKTKPKQKQEEEQAMCNYCSKSSSTAVTIQAVDKPDRIQQERKHLLSRLYSVYHNKESEMRKTFGLEDDDTPSTAHEFVERIKAGMYVLEENKYAAIRWRDPSKKEDYEGYDKANVLVREARQVTEDEITIKDSAEGLESLRAFEKATFS